MKKKNIIIALITVLCICIGIGAFETVNNKNNTKNTTSTVSSTITESENQSEIQHVKDESTKKSSSSAINSTTNKYTSTKANAVKQTTAAAQTTKKKSTTSAKRAATKSSTTKKTTTVKKSFNVSITIRCENAVAYGADVPEYLLSTRTIKVTQGDTAFDALKAACKANSISLKYQSIYYVQGIGGLNEKDCGDTSGWMYRVNGVSPNKAAAKYTLSSGDEIEWYYVTSPSDR